jgi:hypothetical protein
VSHGTRHLFGLLIGLLLLSGQMGAGSAGAHPTPLACPTQQVTWLQGTATPGQALLVRFADTVVGGGRVTTGGQWRIPLTVDAPTGIYPVMVVERTSGELIAAFTCYVDLPVGATSTATPTRRPSQPTTTPQPSATVTITTSPTGTPTLTTPPLPTLTPTTERSMPTATVPYIDTTPTMAPSPSPTPSIPDTSAQPTVVLVMVYADDPDDPELFEYVILENRSATVQTLTDWQLIHQPSGERYTFPAVTLPVDEQLVVWSGAGLDDPAIGAFFWPASTGRWTAGDTAALATPDGQIVSTLQVALPAADEE